MAEETAKEGVTVAGIHNETVEKPPSLKGTLVEFVPGQGELKIDTNSE